MNRTELMTAWLKDRDARGDLLLNECRNEPAHACALIPANDLPAIYMALVAWHPSIELGMDVHKLKGRLEKYVFAQMNDTQQDHCVILRSAFDAMTRAFSDAQ